MVRQPLHSSPGHPHEVQAPDLFSASRAFSPISPRFWLMLVARRPLVLLGTLWLVIVCLSAFAYHRLMTNNSAETSNPITRSLPEVRRDPGSSTAPRRRPPTADPMPPSGELSTQVTLWGLASLVGLSSLGCVVISQQAKASRRRPMAAKAKPLRPVPKPMAKAGPRRLAPYQPQRDGVIVRGAGAVLDLDWLSEGSLAVEVLESPALEPAIAPPPHEMPSLKTASVLPPRLGASTPQRPGSAPSLPQAQGSAQPRHRPSSPPAPTAVAPATPISPATVVPEDEAHPLDWPDESLAHSLDLRQRRSLSSLM